MAKQTKTTRVADTLRKAIGAQYKLGASLPPVRSLMTQFGVSLATIRSALDILGNEGVVRTDHGKGTFVVDPPAGQGAGRGAKPAPDGHGFKTVVIAGPELADIMTAGPVRGLQKVLLGEDCAFTFLCHQADTHRELANLRQAEKMPVDALVVSPIPGNLLSPSYHKQILRLQRAGLLIIFAYLYLPDVPTHVVTTDDYLGAALAARHLLELGHRRIGLLGGTMLSSDLQRWNGFVDTLKAAGVAQDQSLLVDMPMPANGFLNTRWPIQNLLARQDRPTAVFCLNDWVARDVYAAAQKLGLRIPQDLSVVGFDDRPEAARLTPPLTTIRQNFEELGVAIGTIVKAHWDGPGAGKLSSHVFAKVKPELVVRDSTRALVSR